MVKKNTNELIGCERDKMAMVELTSQFPISECTSNGKCEEENDAERYYEIGFASEKSLDEIFKDNYRSCF